MNKKLTYIIIFFISLFPIISLGQQSKKNSIQTYIDTQLKTDTLFTNSIVGIYVTDENGKKLAEWNPNYNLIPASNLKTITTGLALLYLGGDYRYSTKIGISGSIKDSVLNGNVYIIGGGDPTLGSNNYIATPIDTVFSTWKRAISKVGIKKVTGNIIVDDRWFEREQMPDSWTWDDFGTYYGCAPNGLSFCENIQYYTLTSGENVGDSANIVDIFPIIPNFKLVNEVVTSKKEEKDKSYYYTQDMYPIGKYIGSIPIDTAKIIVKNSNKFPHLSCGYHFMEFLNNNGISISRDIIDVKDFDCSDSTNIPVIIEETFSPELIKIIEITNKESNNFYAETIFKTIGKEFTGVGRYDSSVAAVNGLLKKKGMNIRNIKIVDGSGLSRQNLINPKFMCNFYIMMKENGIFAEFLQSFPYPGCCGTTLENVLAMDPKWLKERIRAKSGSLSGVRCYSGYVKRGYKYGTICFSIMVNNFTVKTAVIQPKIEKFMLEIARCN